jgi:hypothetical protein
VQEGENPSVKEIRGPGQRTSVHVLRVDEPPMGKGDSSLWTRIVEEGPFGTFVLPTLPISQRRLAFAQLPAVGKTGLKVAELPTLI